MPLFQPLGHWLLECLQPSSAYTKAADTYCVGGLMMAVDVVWDAQASALHQRLTFVDPAGRPSALDAVLDPWQVAG